MKRWIIFCIGILFSSLISKAQWQWKNVDSLYQPLPKGVHVYTTTDETEGKPNIAYYVSADLHEKSLHFSAQTGNGKRFTPSQYFEQENRPLLVMNTTFFEFVHNRNLNVVIKDGSLRAYQVHTLPLKGKDTLTYRHVFGSAIGISKNTRLMWPGCIPIQPQNMRMPVSNPFSHGKILFRITVRSK